MDLKIAENTLIKKITFDLSEHFPDEDAKQYVKMREMSTQEMIPFTAHQKELSKKDPSPTAIAEVTKTFIETLPDLIVEHSFTVDDGKAAPNKAVVKLLAGKQPVFQELMYTYVNAQTFRRGKNTN